MRRSGLHLALLLAVGTLSADLGAQTQLRGTVRDNAGAAIPRAEAYVVDEETHAIADDSGRFVLSLRGHRTVSLRVRRIGFVVAERRLDVPDTGAMSVTITLQALPQSVATLRVVARRAGLYGTVRTVSGVPLPDVEIQVLGAGARTTVSDVSGQFDMALKASGTFYLLARKRGFAYVRSSLVFNADSGREADIVMTTALDDDAAGFGRTEFILKEAGTRIAMKSPAASVVSRDVLESKGAISLSEALCGTQLTTNFPKARCPVAPDPPDPPGKTIPSFSRFPNSLRVCILINGDQRSFLPLSQFSADQVESVEFYPKNSDHSETLKTRQCPNTGGGREPPYDVFVVWLRRDR